MPDDLEGVKKEIRSLEEKYLQLYAGGKVSKEEVLEAWEELFDLQEEYYQKFGKPVPTEEVDDPFLLLVAAKHCLRLNKDMIIDIFGLVFCNP